MSTRIKIDAKTGVAQKQKSLPLTWGRVPSDTNIFPTLRRHCVKCSLYSHLQLPSTRFHRHKQTTAYTRLSESTTPDHQPYAYRLHVHPGKSFPLGKYNVCLAENAQLLLCGLVILIYVISTQTISLWSRTYGEKNVDPSTTHHIGDGHGPGTVLQAHMHSLFQFDAHAPGSFRSINALSRHEQATSQRRYS